MKNLKPITLYNDKFLDSNKLVYESGWDCIIPSLYIKRKI
jgi:hypothetical protein